MCFRYGAFHTWNSASSEILYFWGSKADIIKWAEIGQKRIWGGRGCQKTKKTSHIIYVRSLICPNLEKFGTLWYAPSYCGGLWSGIQHFIQIYPQHTVSRNWGKSNTHFKGELISEGILTLVPLPTKGAKSNPWAENLNKLFTEKVRKFKFSVQGRDLASFVGKGTKFKIPSEIKTPLARKTFLTAQI